MVSSPRRIALSILALAALFTAGATGSPGAGGTASRPVADPGGADPPQVYAQGRPPAQQAAAPAAPRGTATISVSVVVDGGKTPVKGARVMLTAVPASTQPTASTAPGQAIVAELQIARDRGAAPARLQRQARTGPGGWAAFTELPAGDYIVYAGSATGYVVPGNPPTRVRVRAGGQATAVVELNRAGVITGRVVDEDGDPVTGAYVSALRLSRSGRAQSAGGATQPTNDLGIYRIWNLAPGDYFVSTHYEDRAATVESRASDENALAVEGYLPTYYPGVAAFDAARPVRVGAGQETGAVDLPLVRGRLGAVTVRVTDSAGTVIGAGGPAANVTLVSRSRNPAYTNRGGGMRQDGSYHITNVPAGDYYVSAMLVRGSGPNPVREGVYVPVSVNGDEVALSLQTNQGATINGRVVLEGTPPAQSGSPGSPSAGGRPPAVRVATRIAGDTVFAPAFAPGAGNQGAVRPDGTFTLTGVRGPVQIVGSHARAGLKAVRRGATDVSGQSIELTGTERIDDVVVVMTYDTGGIEGTVVDDSDEPLASAAVLVVPEDPDKWSAGSPFVRPARIVAGSPGSTAAAATPGVSTVGQAGGAGGTTFQATLLPPGRYVVIGFADISMLDAPDRPFIEQWRGEGTVITVDAGTTATVKVRAIR